MKNGNWRINLSPSQKHSAKREQYRRVRKEATLAIGRKCVRCGYSDIRALQIDHKNIPAPTKKGDDN